MPNVLHITVENPDEILNAGAYATGALIRVQWAATETGTYADISGTGSTPTIAVVTAIREYTGYDPGGISSTWYKTRYENAGATRLSDWSAPFQVGDETAGQLCSIYDVSQRLFGTATPSSNTEYETLLDIIREVSDDIEDYVGAWLAPRPTNPGSTTTLVFDVPDDDYYCHSVRLEQGGRLCGIRSFTSLGTASTDQPDTGGSYTTATASAIVLRPKPTDGQPALRVETSDESGVFFYGGYNTLTITGAFGPAAVSPRVQGVAIAAVTRRYMGKETATAAVSVGPDGGVRLLADLPPGMKDTLDRLRVPNVG